MKRLWFIVILVLLILIFSSLTASAYFFQQGRQEIRKKNLDVALKDFRLASYFNPFSKEALKQLCFTYDRLKQEENAFRFCKRAILLGARDFDTYTVAGLIGYNIKHYKEAANYLEKARAFSADLLLTKLLGDTFVALGDYESARNTYFELVKDSPKFPPIQFWFLFEFASLKSNNTSDALSLLAKWSAASSVKEELIQIAKAYRRLGNSQKADEIEQRINLL